MASVYLYSPAWARRAARAVLGRLLAAPLRPLVNLVRSLACRSVIHPLAFIGPNVEIGRSCLIGRCRLDTMDGAGRLRIGDHTVVYGGSEVLVHGGSVTIGRECLITRRATLITGNHRHARRDVPIQQQGIEWADVTVGDDVWIGYGAIVLKGVTVGRGAVVGAGSVVTRDVAPYTVVGGVPARRLGERTAEQTEPSA